MIWRPDGRSPEWAARRRLRLFCFPYAGSGATVFRGWPRAVPTSVEVCAVELPGRGFRLREQCLTRVSVVVEQVAREVRAYLDEPFCFFGHSMGALVAFELTRELRRRGGRMPTRLFLSAACAPHLARQRRPLHALGDVELVQALRELEGTPTRVLESPELLELILPTIRSDFEVVETYTYAPEPPLDCPIVVFGGEQDPFVPRTHLEAWREHTAAGFALRMLPGDHFFLANQSAFLPALCEQLVRTMASLPASADRSHGSATTTPWTSR